MSLLNGNNGKNKKKAAPAPVKTGLSSPKGKSNTKAPVRNTKLTGGSQRGS